jgi:hypothetical protein
VLKFSEASLVGIEIAYKQRPIFALKLTLWTDSEKSASGQ